MPEKLPQCFPDDRGLLILIIHDINKELDDITDAGSNLVMLSDYTVPVS
jgi:hypothetical protein